jgi:hypothetical protein
LYTCTKIGSQARYETTLELLQDREVADGIIVGSDLKTDGYTWNPLDPARVESFMRAARP